MKNFGVRNDEVRKKIIFYTIEINLLTQKNYAKGVTFLHFLN